VTFTDALIAAITAELEYRRPELDKGDDVRRVQLVVHVDRGTRNLRSVVYHAERERAVARARPRIATKTLTMGK
jgi:hypothetical protein